jgi:SAM-dependent methyltransferase
MGRRFSGLEALWDPSSREVLGRMGVGEGWHCLEVGAGGGSMSAWLARRVGRGGRVVAVDADPTEELLAVRGPNLEVAGCDIRSEGMPGGRFRLVYARLVVEYIGGEVALGLAEHLQDGGTLVIEDYDWAYARASSQPVSRSLAAYRALLEVLGLDPRFGARLPQLLRAAGLEGVQEQVRTREGGAAGPVGRLYRLAFGTAAPALLGQGLIARPELEAALEAIEDPTTVLRTPALIACWGSRAG